MDQLHALGLTLACELPAMALLARRRPVARVLLAAATASCLTHPLAWRAAAALSPQQYAAGLLLIEAAVVAAEALWYGGWLRAGFAVSLWWSLLANAASFAVGWLLLRA